MLCHGFFRKVKIEKNEFQAENNQIFHYLQNLLTSISLAKYNYLSLILSHLYKFLLMYVLLSL